MSRAGELIKNTAIVAFGKACTKLLSFFLLPFYTAVLSTEDYGIVDLFNTYVSLLLPLVVFQIEDALFRFAIDVRNDKESRKKLVSTVFGFCTAQSLIFIVVYLVIQSFIEIPYSRYFMLNVITSIFSGAMLQLSRGLGDNYSYAFSSFLTAVTAIAMNILLVLFLYMGAEGLLLTAILSNLIGITYIVVKLRVWSLFKIRYFDGRLLKEMLAYSLPLVPNYLSWWIIGASDKSVVNWFLGVSQNGILSVSQKFSSAYTTFYSIFNLTWTENAAIHREDQDHEQYFSQVIETAFRILSGVCLGIIAVVALAFPLLVNEKFDDSYYQIPIYMLSSLLYSTIGIYSVVYVAYKKTGQIAWTSMVAAAVNLTVNIGLIKIIGLYAASISSVIAYGVLLLIRLFDIRRFAVIKIKKSTIFSTIVFMGITFLSYYIRDTQISVVNLLLAAGYVLYMNRAVVKVLFTAASKVLNKKKGKI